MLPKALDKVFKLILNDKNNINKQPVYLQQVGVLILRLSSCSSSAPCLKSPWSCHQARALAAMYPLSPDEGAFPRCACLSSLSIVCGEEGGQVPLCEEGGSRKMDYAKRGILSPISEGWGVAGRLQEDKKFRLSLAKCKLLCRPGLFWGGWGWGMGSPGEGGGGC